MHGVTLDVHAQDRVGLLARILWVVRKLHAARFASTAGLDLRLHHDGTTDLRSHGFGLSRCRAHIPLGGRYAMSNEEFFGLVFVKVHSSPWCYLVGEASDA